MKICSTREFSMTKPTRKKINRTRIYIITVATITDRSAIILFAVPVASDLWRDETADQCIKVEEEALE
jgi:hypothetical protein